MSISRAAYEIELSGKDSPFAHSVAPLVLKQTPTVSADSQINALAYPRFSA